MIIQNPIRFNGNITSIAAASPQRFQGQHYNTVSMWNDSANDVFYSFDGSTYQLIKAGEFFVFDFVCDSDTFTVYAAVNPSAVRFILWNQPKKG